MRDTALGELLGQVLRALDTGGTDQNRLTLLVPLDDVVDDGTELGFLALVDEVAVVHTHHRAVGGNGDDTERVRLVQLGRLGLGGTGHAGELVVQTEVVLQRDRGEGLVLGLDLHLLLGLDGLVHALVVAAPHQDAAGELVDDDDVAVSDDVVLVALVELLRLDGVVQVAHQRRVGGLVQVVDAQLVLDELDARLVHTHRALLDVHLVVDVLLHHGGDAGELRVPLRRRVRGARDDQRGTGLVDEDRVHLVHHGEVVSALDQVVQRVRHVVAEVVETELVVGAVRDVGRVGGTPLGGRHAREDHVHAQSEEAVNAAHPLRVTLGQVVVDRDDVDAVTGQRVQVRREDAGEGLALTGLHLGDVAEVQRGAAHDLDVEVALGQHPLGRLAGDRERLGQQFVEALAVLVPLRELVGLRTQFGVRQGLDVRRQGRHVVGDVLQPLDHATFTDTEQLGQRQRRHGLFVLNIGYVGREPSPSTRGRSSMRRDLVGLPAEPS